MIEEIADQEINQKQIINLTKIHKAVLVLVLVFVLFSCDSKRVYEDFYTTRTTGWNKDSIAVFDVEITDTITNYNLLISCRNMENYAYNNLWLFVDVISPDSMAIRDTLEYELALPNGKWTGKGTGGVYENQFSYRSNVYFPHSGVYRFQIQQGMRDDNLKGLKNIGVRIEKK